MNNYLIPFTGNPPLKYRWVHIVRAVTVLELQPLLLVHEHNHSQVFCDSMDTQILPETKFW